MPTIYKPKKKKNESQYNSERRAIYNSERWKRIRRIKYANSPLCERCYQEGRIVPAEDIHHIVSFMSADNHSERMRLAYDYDNLMSLCKKCHQYIHNVRHL